MYKNTYEVEVLVNGRPAREYFQNGKTYLEGRKDTRFSLRLRNHSWSRKLFVPSIDGLSVMDGEECSFTSSGYIVPAQSAITIDGWRISAEDVAAFYFSGRGSSYASRSGKGVANLGVIGCAVFGEKTYYNYGVTTTSWWPFYGSGAGSNPIVINNGANNLHANVSSYALSCSAQNCSASSEVPSNLGTGWGETKRMEVTTVSFDRSDAPEAVIELLYNTRERLQELGVVFKTPVYVAPQAFPGQYCRPPQA